MASADPVEPIDDPSVDDGDEGWRSVFARQVQFDENLGRERPNTDAWRLDGGLSVYLASVLTGVGLGPQAVLDVRAGEEVWALPVGAARKLELVVVRRPDLNETVIGFAHAEVHAPAGLSRSRRGKLGRKLARSARRMQP